MFGNHFSKGKNISSFQFFFLDNAHIYDIGESDLILSKISERYMFTDAKKVDFI